MGSKLGNIDIKNSRNYFFDDMINIKSIDLNKTKIDEKSYKNILIYYIGCLTFKDLEYVKIDSVNPLYLIIYKMNGYFRKVNGHEYLTLVPNNERKEIIKKYEEIWSKLKDQIETITDNSDDYDEKYMKTKLNSDDDLRLNKTLGLYNMTIAVRALFHESHKYYPQVFLDECLCKL